MKYKNRMLFFSITIPNSTLKYSQLLNSLKKTCNFYKENH